MNTLLEALKEDDNYTTTWNGAKTHKSSFSSLLDFFAQGGALRQVDEADIEGRFSKAFGEDRLLALKTIFYFRDIRGGQGERRVFRVVMRWLAKNHPDFARANLEIVPLYGRWDDLLYAFDGTALEESAYQYFADQLKEDYRKLENGEEGISLAAKWSPSENASSGRTKTFGTHMRRTLDLTSKAYRKMLSALRKEIGVLERTLCQGTWEDIQFSKIPSRAHFKYRKAFARNQGDRYASYLSSVERGEEKINVFTLYPYDIVRNARGHSGPARDLDVMWNNLPDYVGDAEHSGLVVCDTSGSMTWGGIGGNVQPIDVSVSLALYMAERARGPFAGHFLTFNSDSHLIKVQGSTIVEKVRNTMRAPWGGSTNLQSAFRSILDAAVKNGVAPEDMPKTIYIISDMQFNTNATGTNYGEIKNKYASAGYELPKIVFWNVNAVRGDSPVTVKDSQTVLASGFSPVIFEQVIKSAALTPFDMMLEVICKPRYDYVRVPV